MLTCAAAGCEGIVSKRADSPYRDRVRSRDWLKVKCWRTNSYVVGGIERDAGDRVVALLVGSPDGTTLRYEGRVEFGLSRVASAWENAVPTASCPFGGMGSQRRQWIEPRTFVKRRALPRRLGTRLRHATALRARAAGLTADRADADRARLWLELALHTHVLHFDRPRRRCCTHVGDSSTAEGPY